MSTAPKTRGPRAPIALTVLVAALVTGCTTGTDAPAAPTAPATAPVATLTGSPTPTAPATPSPTPGETSGGTEAAPPPPPETPAAPGTPLTDVDVVVTFAGWNAGTQAVEIGAYVAVVEMGVTCTLTLTGPGGRTATAVSTGQPDASTTSCGALVVPRDQLTAGRWSGTVDVTSQNVSGRTTVEPMDIP